MTASERLRELDAAIMHGYLRDGGGPLATLSLALPEIVAVVEAAERVVHADDALILTGMGPHPTPCRICVALAALEEKLSA